MLGKAAAGFRIHPVFQQQELVVKMSDAATAVASIGIVHGSAVAAAEGKGPGDADGTHGIQPIRILHALSFQGVRWVSTSVA